MFDETIPRDEVAELLGVTVGHLQRREAQGRFPRSFKDERREKCYDTMTLLMFLKSRGYDELVSVFLELHCQLSLPPSNRD
jgi:hypothetical protein